MLKFKQKLIKSSQLNADLCCISYRNQSFDLFGFYMKCNTGLKLRKIKSYRNQSIDLQFL